MSWKATTWRVGYTVGGAIGVWTHGSKADEPDVCLVARVPCGADVKTAYLIAAAPDMLAALKGAFKVPRPWMGGSPRLTWPEWEAAVTAIEAAIAKAGGPR